MGEGGDYGGAAFGAVGDGEGAVVQFAEGLRYGKTNTEVGAVAL